MTLYSFFTVLSLVFVFAATNSPILKTEPYGCSVHGRTLVLRTGMYSVHTTVRSVYI